MQDAFNAVLGVLNALLQHIVLYVETFRAHDIWSFLIGAFAATLFELPIISRFKRH